MTTMTTTASVTLSSSSSKRTARSFLCQTIPLLAAFYGGLSIGLHACPSACSPADFHQSQLQVVADYARNAPVLGKDKPGLSECRNDTSVNAILQQKLLDANFVSKQRFPDTTHTFMLGAALVNRTAFLETFDIGTAQPHEKDNKNQHVYILYQHRRALPTKQVQSASPLSVLSVEEATQNCLTLNIVSTKPYSMANQQCTAIVGQYESLYMQRYMRVADEEPLKQSLSFARTGQGMDYMGRNWVKPPPGRFQQEHWMELTRYFLHFNDVRTDLRKLLQNMTRVRAFDGEAEHHTRPAIVVMVCNLGQADLLINFACVARAKGLLQDVHILVFCTDPQTRDLATALGLQAYYHKDLFAEIPEIEARNYGDEIFANIMFIKVIAVHLVNQLGYEVFYQDVDVVWNENPVPYFRTHYSEFDVILQDDGARSLRFAPHAGNTGLYYVRHNVRTKYLFTNLLYIGDQVKRSGSHQQGLNILLAQHGTQFGLRVKTMSENDLFPGGFTYHRKLDRMRDIVDATVKPLIFHFCWTQTRSDKLKFMQQMGMWQVRETCQTGSKAFQVLKTSGDSDFGSSCCAEAPLLQCHFSDAPSIIPCRESPLLDPNGGKPFW